MELMKCIQPGCGRTGDDIGTCGSALSCPSKITPSSGIEPVQANGRDIIIECQACGITRAYTTAAIVAGAKVGERICRGETDHCQARARTLTAKVGLQEAPKVVAKTSAKKD